MDRSSQISMAFFFGANFHTGIQFRNFLVSNSLFIFFKKLKEWKINSILLFKIAIFTYNR